MSEEKTQYIVFPGYKPQAFDLVVKMERNAKNLHLFVNFPDALSPEEQTEIIDKTNLLRETMEGHQPSEYFNEIETYFGMPANSLLGDYLNGIFLTTLDHCYMTVFGKYMDDVIEHKEKTRDFEFILVFLLFLVRKKLTKTLPRIIVWDVDSQPNLQLN
jgi:hypothetical protein